MSYPEHPDVRTGKSPEHQRNALKAKVPSGPVFTYETVEEVKEQLRRGLKFPYVGVQSSELGGKDRVSILIAISMDPKETWNNGIFENSRCARIHIDKDGKTEQFSGWKIKMRGFKGKSIDQIITKINAIKEPDLERYYYR